MKLVGATAYHGQGIPQLCSERSFAMLGLAVVTERFAHGMCFHLPAHL